MSGTGAHISNFYKSFSGTDTLAFIMIPGCAPVWLGSLTTISYSMYRNKKPVINIGRTNINGVTRGSRIYAGTMIFTLINQHWLKEVQENDRTKWLGQFKDLKVDELPLFDIMIVSANEYGNAVSMYIYGIDFTDEAQTISVEDLFTENTFSFIARDIATFKALNVFQQRAEKHSPYERKFEFQQRYYVIDHSKFTFDQLDELEREHKSSIIQFNQTYTRVHRLQRELYYPTANPFIGNDVMEIQQLLNGTRLFDLTINGIYNQETAQAVREYQYSVGLPPTGIMNERTYNSLLNGLNQETNEGRLAVIVNKYGTYIYEKPFLYSNIVGTEAYQEQIIVLDLISIEENEVVRKWYKTEKGYIIAEDMYSSYYQAQTLEFPTLQYNDASSYVTLMQTALAKLYPSFTTVNGEFDYATIVAVKRFQAEHGIDDTGVVDYQTWLLLEQYSNEILNKISDDNFELIFSRDPGTYEIKQNDILQELREFKVTMSCGSSINIKMTATCIYHKEDDDNVSTVITKEYTIREAQTFIFDNVFRNAFVYNPKIGKVPDVVDIVIYPFNKTPYKWSIRYS